MNALPAILWIIGVVSALAVCAVTIVRSHYHDGKAADVRPVSWAVIGAHFVTLILVALPYPIYLQHKDMIGAHARMLYGKLGWASAAIAVGVIVLELVLMYLQARRAMLAQEARRTAAQQSTVAPANTADDVDDVHSKQTHDDDADEWPSTLV
ncbi:C4-dicarboxylate ABC transporter [uncultured Bifidobacterium sp.]|uniref:C4-dicarboxylate ABC transporter n=1 Tax=uncultured Bifidobacterium sp. TaxID=165187 RepID=UPI00258FA873|nr:C4-dicarboxylate ABC transporter [uncultured Bifidobacterium sp.]MEE0654259.1 C4-dicarboxylate ABC transporter [Bifidobacterium criceti]